MIRGDTYVDYTGNYTAVIAETQRRPHSPEFWRKTGTANFGWTWICGFCVISPGVTTPVIDGIMTCMGQL